MDAQNEESLKAKKAIALLRFLISMAIVGIVGCYQMGYGYEVTEAFVLMAAILCVVENAVIVRTTVMKKGLGINGLIGVVQLLKLVWISAVAFFYARGEVVPDLAIGAAVWWSVEKNLRVLAFFYNSDVEP
jgi:hypothetical protein